MTDNDSSGSGNDYGNGDSSDNGARFDIGDIFNTGEESQDADEYMELTVEKACVEGLSPGIPVWS